MISYKITKDDTKKLSESGVYVDNDTIIDTFSSMDVKRFEYGKEHKNIKLNIMQSSTKGATTAHSYPLLK